jgi:hypothetical protein
MDGMYHSYLRKLFGSGVSGLYRVFFQITLHLKCAYLVHTGFGYVYDKHGSLDVLSLSYGPFYFGRRRMKNKL